MKKNLLSLSIAAAIGGLTLAGAANAAVSVPGTAGTALTATTATQLSLSSGGIGHIGVIPYFTTQNGNSTLFSITNTDTNNGKAVKVRFRSAVNSDDVFDFTLFLSPGDVWTANISRDATTGTSRLVTNDNSCTLPAQADLNRGFVLDRLPAVTASFTADQRASWSREGYIEVLTMADIPPTYAAGSGNTAGTGTAPTGANALFTAIKHVNGVAPCTAAPLSALLTVPDNATAAQLGGYGFDTPSTGLYTNAVILNASGAFMAWSTESTAVSAVDASFATARGRVVFAPQTSANYSGTASDLSADPLFVVPAGATAAPLTALQFDFPDLSTPYTSTTASNTGLAVTQANNLSAALAVSSVSNDYSTESSIGSKTDFTFSLPTRRYGVAVAYTGGTNGAPLLVENAGNTYFASTARSANGAPVTATNPAVAANSTLSGNVICVSAGSPTPVTAYDRSETFQTSGAVVSPGTATSLSFCGEVSVLTVNNDSTAPAGKGVLSAALAVQNVFTRYQSGWINIATPGRGALGLPVLGSAYTSAIGLPANGVSTNYGWTFKHKTVKANGLVN